jgi:hypothetical protein
MSLQKIWKFDINICNGHNICYNLLYLNLIFAYASQLYLIYRSRKYVVNSNFQKIALI